MIEDTMSLDVPSPLSRRIVLTGLISVAAVPVLTGCGIHLDESVADGGDGPDADERARRAVVTRLRDAYSTADRLDAEKDLAATLTQVRTMLTGQLAALDATVSEPTQPLPNRDSGKSKSGTGPAQSGAQDPTAASLVTSVNAVRRTSLGRLNRVSGVFARRLAGIAAAAATAAHAIGQAADVRVPTVSGPTQKPTGKPSSPAPVATPSSGPAKATRALGNGLYAAIYGYEVLTVRLTGTQRTIAARRLGALRQSAADVGAQLRSANADPAHPEAGYSLPYPIDDAASATKFASAIERRLEMRIGAVTTAVPAGTRADSVDWLTQSALARWKFSKTLPVMPGSKLPGRISQPTASPPSSPTDTKSGKGQPSGSGS